MLDVIFKLNVTCLLSEDIIISVVDFTCIFRFCYV